MCFYAIDFLKSACLGLLYLNGMKTLWYRLKHYIFQSDAFSAIDFLIPQSTVPICPVYESKHSIKAHPFNLNKNELKKKKCDTTKRYESIVVLSIFVQALWWHCAVNEARRIGRIVSVGPTAVHSRRNWKCK